MDANKISINTLAWIKASYSKRLLNKSTKRAATFEKKEKLDEYLQGKWQIQWRQGTFAVEWRERLY